MTDDFSGKEKRRHPRGENAFAVFYDFKLSLPVNLSTSAGEYPAIAIDVSQGGIGLDIDRPLPVDANVKMRFELINQYAVAEDHRCLKFNLDGQVRHCTARDRKRYHVGVKFLQVTPRESDFIAVFIRDLNLRTEQGPERQNKDVVSGMNERRIISMRVLPAKREHVWRAWSEPAHLMQWWGPKGFTNTLKYFDFRPGGAWDFVMHGPDGTDYPNRSVFVEIAKPELIIFQHLKPAHEFLATITLEDLGGKTRLVFCLVFESAAECVKVKDLVLEANEQNFDRLEVQLGKIV